MNIQKEIETLCSKTKWTKPRGKYDEAIEGCLIPNMLGLLNDFIEKHAKIPTRQEYSTFALETMKMSIQEKHIPGLINRLERAYPSLLRDLHFYHFLKNGNWDVIQSAELDKYGIDIIVRFKDYLFYVHLYVATRNARAYRENKKKIHGELDDKAFHIDLPIDISKSPNKLKLYSITDVSILHQKIQECLR